MIYSHVSCEGWEDDIRNCEKQQYEDFTCPHYTVAGVMCSNGKYTCYYVTFITVIHLYRMYYG